NPPQEKPTTHEKAADKPEQPVPITPNKNQYATGDNEPDQKKHGRQPVSYRISQTEHADKKTKIEGIAYDDSNSIPVLIVGERFQEGIAVVRFVSKRDHQIEGWHSAISFLFNRKDLDREKYKVWSICCKRSENMAEDLCMPANYTKVHKAMQDGKKVWPFREYVRLYDNVDDNNHENLMTWMQMFKGLTDKYINGKKEDYPFENELKWRNNYIMGGDLTMEPKRTISRELRNEDVMRIMTHFYPNETPEELVEQYSENFFGKWTGAKDYIFNWKKNN
ncbi:MAG: hypothetical protein SGARI_000536, partial [Bacillariaceae sp.]